MFNFFLFFCKKKKRDAIQEFFMIFSIRLVILKVVFETNNILWFIFFTLVKQESLNLSKSNTFAAKLTFVLLIEIIRKQVDRIRSQNILYIKTYGLCCRSICCKQDQFLVISTETQKVVSIELAIEYLRKQSYSLFYLGWKLFRCKKCCLQIKSGIEWDDFILRSIH